MGYLFITSFGMYFAKFIKAKCWRLFKQVMNRPEKRKYNRVPITLELSCHKVRSPDEKSYTGSTVNISPGGLYFQTTSDVFNPGNLVSVELSIPPTTGLLEFGGRISGLGNVLRIHNIVDSRTDLSSDRYGIAVEFCQPLKLRT